MQYQYWLYNPAVTPAWSQWQAYSTSATCVWTPTVAGNYLISATAKDGISGVEMNTTAWYTVTSGVPLTAVSVTSSCSSPQLNNTSITLTATATGGTNVQYQFWAYNPAATPAWNPLQAYSSMNTCNWIPVVAGNYFLSITAKDGATGVEVNTTTWFAIVSGPPLTAVSVMPSVPSPVQVNTPITLTATATGGSNVQYQFWVYNPAVTPAWSLLQAYSPSNTCSWTPTTAGASLLSITAQDGVTGTEVNTTLWYTITVGVPLTAVSVTSSWPSPAPAGMPITLTAVATGGTNVQYQFWLYDPAATPAWSQLQAYSTQSTCNWLTMITGSYLISVTAQDESGTEVNTMLWYTIE